MLDLYLIRHATTESNQGGRLQGQTDVLLSPVGEDEACRTAARLANLKQAVALYTSPLKRAVATATPVSDALELSPVEEECWMEMDVGDLAGLTWEEAKVHYPEAIALWYSQPRQVHFPGARESIGQFVARVEEGLRRLLQRHPSGRVLLVSHGGPLNVCLSTLLKLGLPDLFPFSLSNCGISRVSYRNELHVRVHAINDASHLVQSAPFQIP
ncbi:MAG TPA: histidine phosphatase family protein [Candidatus Xenobia bacterium]